MKPIYNVGIACSVASGAFIFVQRKLYHSLIPKNDDLKRLDGKIVVITGGCAGSFKFL